MLEPEAVGMNQERLAPMLRSVRERGADVHPLLVVRHGYAVLQANLYPYQPDVPHELWSATKSVTSALLGIAFKEG